MVVADTDCEHHRRSIFAARSIPRAVCVRCLWVLPGGFFFSMNQPDDQFRRNIVRQDEINAIFVRSELDEAGLTPYEFRVYAHIARRAECWAALDTISDLCGMGRTAVKEAIASLRAKGMISVVSKPGSTSITTLTPPRLWSEEVKAHIDHVRKTGITPTKASKQVEQGDPEQQDLLSPNQGTQSPHDQGVVATRPGGWSPHDHKGTPYKGTPLKDVPLAAEELPHSPESLQADPQKAPPNSSRPPARPRNLLGEAALQACHIDHTTATKTQWGAAVSAVRQIKDAYPAVTSQDLLDLADELRRRWGKDVTGFTPMTLAKHWRPPAASGSCLPESTLPELEDKIRACRGWPHHMEHHKAIPHEVAEYQRLKAKRKEMTQ